MQLQISVSVDPSMFVAINCFLCGLISSLLIKGCPLSSGTWMKFIWHCTGMLGPELSSCFYFFVSFVVIIEMHS